MTDVLLDRTLWLRTELSADPRLAASIARLGRSDYATADVIAESSASEWPGDVAGRLLLTQSRLAASGYIGIGRVRELFSAVLFELEPRGYFGRWHPDFIDEQQVAGHGWVVAGLVQYWAVTGDATAIAAGQRVVDSLIAPAIAQLDRYPRTRPAIDTGDAFGGSLHVENGWRVSTDTWCVVLCLNALVPLYEATRAPDTASLVGRIIELLDGIDVVAERAQLHASLAAARNVARFAELTGVTVAAVLAARIYGQYAQHGRTLNWATFNWFGRPNTWTEPCAIVDSIGLALSLWRITRDPVYLDDVDRIEHSAMSFAERVDGSFGLDTVATAESPTIAPFHPDARWCCTMRGGLGLVDLRDRSALFEDGRLILLLPRAGGIRLTDAHGGEWRIRVVTDYPASGAVQLNVDSAPDDGVSVEVIVGPSGRHAATLPPRAGAVAEVEIGIAATSVELSTGRELRLRGPELLVPCGGVHESELRPIGELPRDMSDPPVSYRLDHAISITHASR